MRPGGDLKNWTARSNYPARGIVPTGPAEMSVLRGIKVRVDTCVENAFALIDEPGAAMEPERLGHISLGQENPRMRMNAAPG